MQDDADRGQETRKAVRLVALCALVAVALYLALGLVTNDDNYLVQLGRYREVEFIASDVRTFDRSTYGDRPILWIFGTSITRDAYDAELIQGRLDAAGSDHAVVKFAYNRGAPVFTRHLVRNLPVHTGDHVITSIAYDNFRRDWLTNDDFTKFGQALMSPDELLTIEELPIATRLEWSLAYTPPGQFHQNRDELGWGLLKEASNLSGWKKNKPKENVRYQPFTRTKRTAGRDRRTGTRLPDDDMLLRPGQSNYDALWQVRDDLRAIGADFTVVSIPHIPWYYQDYIDEPTVERFHDHFDKADLDFVRLTPRGNKAFYDYKHPNNAARPPMSHELADLMATRWGLPVPTDSGAAVLTATQEEVPAVLWRKSAGN